MQIMTTRIKRHGILLENDRKYWSIFLFTFLDFFFFQYLIYHGNNNFRGARTIIKQTPCENFTEKMLVHKKKICSNERKILLNSIFSCYDAPNMTKMNENNFFHFFTFSFFCSKLDLSETNRASACTNIHVIDIL